MIELKHLSTVNESYFQHLKWCLYSTWIFFIMIPIALLHGLFPFFLANVPDKIMANYLKNFKERRILTGQAERYETE
jgi:hypothetical protein